MAHITGGGLPGNLPRILPEGLQVEIDSASWPEPGIFQMIRELGPVRREEMYRAFNMGIGFCMIVDSGESAALIKHFCEQGIEAYQIGVVKPGLEGAVIA